jgi:hypothetical protein
MFKLTVRLGSIRVNPKVAARCWALITLSGVTGCGGAASSMGAGGPGGSNRDNEIRHEACDIKSSSAQAVDANGDGRADLTMVMSGGREVCRAADLDFDGRVDVWTYFDGSGAVTRREFDFDRDGAIDEIQLFAGGQITQKQRASTLSHHIDTWEKYVNGKIVSTERDANGDGRVDQWWDFKTADCPVIHSDIDGNGQPDPASTVEYCKETNYKPPEQIDNTRPEMLKKETDALPTETSNTVSNQPDAAKGAPSAETAKAKSEKSTGSVSPKSAPAAAGGGK